MTNKTPTEAPRAAPMEFDELFAGLTTQEILAKYPQYGPGGRSSCFYDEASRKVILRPEHRERMSRMLQGDADRILRSHVRQKRWLKAELMWLRVRKVYIKAKLKLLYR